VDFCAPTRCGCATLVCGCATLVCRCAMCDASPPELHACRWWQRAGGSEQVAASRWCLLCALTGRLAAGMVRVSVGRGRQGSESVVASLRHTTAVTHRQGEWQSDPFATVTQCVKAARGGGVCNRCVRETDACVRREAQGGLRGRGDGIPHRMDARAEEGAAQGSGRVPPLPPPSSTRLWRWRDVWTAGW